jgi:integrase/recombinase XerC
VRLFGKGRKERLCPLWRETVSLLKALLQRQPRADDERIFVNRYGVPLGASGVRFKLAEYVAAAAKVMPSLASKHVTPHSFRHATAVHLVPSSTGARSNSRRSRPAMRYPRFSHSESTPSPAG